MIEDLKNQFIQKANFFVNLQLKKFTPDLAIAIDSCLKDNSTSLDTIKSSIEQILTFSGLRRAMGFYMLRFAMNTNFNKKYFITTL